MSTAASIVRILDVLAEGEEELSIREMSRRTGLSRSTVQRIAADLAAAGLLKKSAETGHYRLGLRLLVLGGLVQARNEINVVAEPVLKALMRLSGETVHLAILDDVEIVYIAKVESTQAVRVASWVGRRNPPYCTGVGKAILAYQASEVIERIIRHGLRRYTPNTITDPVALRAHLESVRQQGYAFDQEELELGARCVAAPVRDYTGKVIAAISTAGPAHRMTTERMERLIGPVMEGAQEISRQLGWKSQRTPENSPIGEQNIAVLRSSPRLIVCKNTRARSCHGG